MTVRIPTALLLDRNLVGQDIHVFAIAASLAGGEEFTMREIVAHSIIPTRAAETVVPRLIHYHLFEVVEPNEDKPLDVRLRIAPHWWAIMTAEEKQKEIAFAPYQKCPVCSGKGSVQRFNSIQSDITTSIQSAITTVCHACGGYGTVAMAPVKNPAL